MKTILFDLDGTIADSITGIIDISLLACRELSIEWDENKVKSLIGLPLVKSGGILAGEERAQIYCDTYRKHFTNSPKEKTLAFKGLKELLFSLKARGHKIGLVTSKLLPGVLLSLEDLGLEDFFDIVVTASDNCGHKPSPKPALFALEKLGEKAENAFFVGDSPFDIQCGNSAGMISVGVTWGAGTEEALKKAGAAYIARNAEDLEKIFIEA